MEQLSFYPNEIIILSGPSSTGKSHFCQTFFKASQVLSSDTFRLLVSDENHTPSLPQKQQGDCDYQRMENVLKKEYQQYSADAFHLLHEALRVRAKNNKLTVIDATSLWMEDIQSYVKIAKEQHVPVSVIFFDVPLKDILAFDETRDQPRTKAKISRQYQAFRNLKRNKKEFHRLGVRHMYSIQNTNDIEITILPPINVIPLDKGLDVLGDGHGLLQSRIELFEKLGYVQNEEGLFVHPLGRKPVFLNDESSRGSLPLETIQYGEFPSIAMMNLMMKHVQGNLAYAVDSNHNYKIWRWLEGKNVQMRHGDEKVVEEFERFEAVYGTEKTVSLKQELGMFLKSLPSHVVIEDRGIKRAVVTHAGIEDSMIGKESDAIYDYCRFGPTDGIDQTTGRPIRKEWTTSHQNGQLIMWGHEPHSHVFISNDTVNVDTGGFCGHYLSAFRYPELETVQVSVPVSFVPDKDNAILRKLEKRFDAPSLQKYVQGFDVHTSFGVVHADKKLVVEAIEFASTRMAPLEQVFYVAPTMSPTPQVSQREDYLEHPEEAFRYFKDEGVTEVIAEKKHMGSRAVLTLFKTKEIGERYTNQSTLGFIVTRNNAKFFKENDEIRVIERLHHDLLPYFEEMKTDLLVMDAEILPWNLKAKELLNKQYGLTASTAIHKRMVHVERLKEFQENRGVDLAKDIQKAERFLENAKAFQRAFAYYCWDTDINSLEGIQICPFHLLAFSEGTNFHQPHAWHMAQVERLHELSPKLIQPTEYKFLSLDDEQAVEEVTQWWLNMTKDGHEGMIVKPNQFVAYNEAGNMIQPAIKVRGREYLRIIYGMDYLEEENLSRVKKRSARKKMKNALHEFQLSMESTKRFVQQESVERIHECVLAALSYGNEPMDPRL